MITTTAIYGLILFILGVVFTKVIDVIGNRFNQVADKSRSIRNIKYDIPYSLKEKAIDKDGYPYIKSIPMFTGQIRERFFLNQNLSIDEVYSILVDLKEEGLLRMTASSDDKRYTSWTTTIERINIKSQAGKIGSRVEVTLKKD